jgi:transporter family-2 protein
LTNPWIYAVLAGIFTAIETSINAKLGKIVTPNIATLHSLITGAVFILLINLVRGTLGRYPQIIYVGPQWLIGGVFGAFIIYFATKAIPCIGVSNALTIIVASQLISGLLIDVVVLQEQELHLSKIAGVFLFLIGTYLVVK